MSDDSVYLQHISDALADIAAYTGAGRNAFFAERMRQDANWVVNWVAGAMCILCVYAGV